MYRKMTLYRKARQLVRKTGQLAKKRYAAKSGGRKSTGGIRVMKMAKDIMYLKSVLNPEKKVYNAYQLDKQVGQINVNSDGRYFEDVTPVPSQGVTIGTRNGASIKLHSSVWHMQFVQQSATISNMKVCVEIWAIEKEPYGSGSFTWFNEHWKPNPFISGVDVRDYNSSINPDNFMKGKCIARRKFVMAADQLGTEKYVKDIKIPLLYNKGQGRHIRYAADTTNVEHGQLYLVVRTDRGNMGATASTLISNVPEVAPNTGLNFSYNVMNYFYDN